MDAAKLKAKWREGVAAQRWWSSLQTRSEALLRENRAAMCCLGVLGRAPTSLSETFMTDHLVHVSDGSDRFCRRGGYVGL
jgi:hypothetical protein